MIKFIHTRNQPGGRIMDLLKLLDHLQGQIHVESIRIVNSCDYQCIGPILLGDLLPG